jgi:hypothetical protein
MGVSFRNAHSATDSMAEIRMLVTESRTRYPAVGCRPVSAGRERQLRGIRKSSRWLVQREAVPRQSIGV